MSYINIATFKSVPSLTSKKYIFWSTFGIPHTTLFMQNQILKRFIKYIIDFHQKIAKIEDFKVDYNHVLKKTTKFIDNPQNPSNLL